MGRGATKVLLLENISISAQALFAQQEYSVETVATSLSEAELCERLQGVQVLGIRSKTQVSAKVLQEAHDLLCVGCFCIGVNQVDLAASRSHGVPVFNAPFSNTRSVAELVICEIIALARKLCDRSAEVHQGVWRKTAKGCFEVRGKTLGIVGYGHIGSQVGTLAEMLGMQVVYYDIAQKLPLGNARPVSELHELLGLSDFVTLHVPATAQTHKLIGRPQLDGMRPGSYLINISRGGVVDLAALRQALDAHHLAGAAIDVYPQEPEKNSEAFATQLQRLDNVILTPHIGGSTEEAQAAIGQEVARSLIQFINTGDTTGAVQFPQAAIAAQSAAHRILNVHRNIPGVLRDINKIVSDLHANIHSQVLATDANVGYLIMDLDKDVSRDVCAAMGSLQPNIRTRILF
jgi:D-3-phosphoglycerate dehydrogenase